MMKAMQLESMCETVAKEISAGGALHAFPLAEGGIDPSSPPPL